MNYFLTNKLSKPTKDLARYIEDLIFFEFFTFHEFLQITIFTEFCDNVETIFGTKDVFELDDVRMVKPL